MPVRGHVDHYDYETRNNGRYDDNCMNKCEQVIRNKYLNRFSSITIYINIANNKNSPFRSTRITINEWPLCSNKIISGTTKSQ